MTKPYNCHIYAEVLCQSHACSMVDGSDSVSSCETRLVDSVGFLRMSLTPLAPTFFPPPLQNQCNSLLLGILDWSHPCRFLEICFVQVSTETWNASPFPISLLRLFPFTPNLFPYIPTPSSHNLPWRSFLFPFRGRAMSSSLGFFFLPSLSGSVDCCMVMIYS